MVLTENQKQVLADFLAVKKEVTKVQDLLAQVCNKMERRKEGLQQAFASMNGQKIVVKVPRQKPVLVGRKALGGEIEVETIDILT